jgi:hypothetical protein
VGQSVQEFIEGSPDPMMVWVGFFGHGFSPMGETKKPRTEHRAGQERDK